MNCQTIINRAFRKIGVIGAGQSPREVEATDALDTLQSLYSRWINEGAFGALVDVIPSGSTYTAHENERVFRNSDSVTTVILPETVTDTSSTGFIDDYGSGLIPANTASGVSAGLRPPMDGSVVSISDAFTQTTEDYIYDGFKKIWCEIGSITLTDYAPLSSRDPNGLAACLAVELSDEFGQSVGAVTLAAALRFQSGLTHNYSQAREVVTPTSYI